ncbi:hypothetical protein VNO77_41805 [Canavalia gladiata]|uniref:Glycosyltransferase n=1 Tax=Canavalia gladiata TaxID=3824 RepID=A0AAN9JZJ2_CANGL
MEEKMDEKLHIMFLPFLAFGHMIPMGDMARVFSARGVRASIVTTPVNAPTFSWTESESESEIEILTVKFPCAEVGLPEGCENTESVPSPDMLHPFFKATTMLQAPLEELLLKHRPHCLIAASFFPWATQSAAKFKIPRLVFHGTGAFALCASECVRLYKPYKNVSSDSEPFPIPHLPGEIKITRMVLPEYIKSDAETDFTRAMEAIRDSEVASLGVVVNSFYELEEVYADYYKEVLGRNTWHIGPVSVCMRKQEKGRRGKAGWMDEGEVLKWLNSKEPNTVVYVCFGSVANFNETQLQEIAKGLEASGQHFIWVVRRSDRGWLPEGFETRMKGKGLIMWGWAPQLLILQHQAVGGFVTHCGWNSTLEAISAGVPMVTWPVSAEQFYNEKFVTDLLQIGVPVGAKQWVRVFGDSVTGHAIEKALNRIMTGEEAEAMRNRAHKLAQMATAAVQQPKGSSYCQFAALIQHIRSYRMP